MNAPTYQHFSTRGLARVERIGLWEQHNAQSLLPLAVRSLDGTVLDASEDNVRLPHLTFARVVASPHVVERTVDHITSSATDGAALYFTLTGDAFFYHQDGVQLQRPGTLLVCDVTQPFLRGFARNLHEYVLTMPRAVFEEATETGMPKGPIVRSFADAPGGDRHAAALAELIRRTLADTNGESLVETENAAMGLLRSMLSPDSGDTSASYRSAALAWIRHHLRDPSISVATVAEAVGVSERTLARSFSDVGQSVARNIREQRLDLAYRLLSRRSAPTVQDVAVYCGFVSPTHFSRVFRERFEQSPAEVVATAL